MILFRVKKYIAKDSPFAFKIDLRSACKKNSNYFKKVPNYAKNFGCLVFGQKNSWRSLISTFLIAENNGRYDFEIAIDSLRFSYVAKELGISTKEIKALLEDGLERLQKDGLIGGYDEQDWWSKIYR